MQYDLLAAIGKLSGVLLAATIALHLLLKCFLKIAIEIIHSDLNGREIMIFAFIFLMLVIVSIWAYSIYAFTRHETKILQINASRLPKSTRNQEDKKAAQEIKKMADL